MKLSIDFFEDIIPKMKKQIEVSICSPGKNLFKKNTQFSFQLLGYDFILDKNFEPWILEINDNPGISTSPLYDIFVPRLLDDAFRLTLDEIYKTKFNNNCFDEKGIYKSKFKVFEYSDYENLW